MPNHLSVANSVESINCANRRDSGFPDLAEEVSRLESTRLIHDRVRSASDSDTSPSLCMIRNWIADLQDAILNVDLSTKAEFSVLMALMIGLGLRQTELAASLGCDENTVNRYAMGQNAPRSVAQRRGVLLETYRLLQSRLNDGSLRAIRPIVKNAKEAQVEAAKAAYASD
ncbi:hypothetical protein [uncultured Erythrobacter sp.]|uniref:hypothetical protein n=1 Tax=uncultured Erythrobacter sp. TaxID=263913 RepID=UPI002613AA88|nr:hypothetical protein [uncultured Erythrobacter sp.]